MKLKVLGSDRNNVGGGSTFCRNLRKAISQFGWEFTDSEDYDVLLIPSASLAEREYVGMAREKGKKIVLRVDNILEDAKNRSTGMSKMRDFAKLSDVVVYQSEWAKRLLNPYCGKGIVIKNGVDTDIFYPRETEKDWDNIRVFYGRYSRGEGKNLNVVQYFWREYCIDKEDDVLVLVGNFSEDNFKINNPFEFHNDELFEYKGVLSPEEMASCLRSCDVALLPYFADAFPNQVLEAQACGLPVIYEEYGGTKEAVQFGQKLDWSISPVDMVKFALGAKRTFTREDSDLVFGLENMGRQYTSLFTLLLKGENDI